MGLSLKIKSILLIIFFFFVLNYLITYTKKETSQSKIASNKKNIVTNPYNYNLVLEPNRSMCAHYTQKEKLLLFILIVSSPDAHNIRHLIRTTWYKSNIANNKYKIIFTVGLSQINHSNEILKLENQKYNDILQADLIDSYHILTIKNMLTFRWINKHCSNTYFILKVCDDVLVNIDELVFYLKNNINYRNTIFGYIWINAYPKRDEQSKWYVSLKEFSETFYPPFPSGTAIVFSGDLSKSFYEYALGFPAPPFSIWMDDVYFGMIGAKLKTKFVDIINSYVPQDHYANYTVKKKIELIKENFVNRTLFVFAKENEYKELWDILCAYYKIG